MDVEEWLDQVHIHLREQHPNSNYSFISIGADTKMASFSCMSSFLIKKSQFYVVLLKIAIHLLLI